MKLQFDATQEYQLSAIKAITDLFKGQPLHKGDFEIEMTSPENQLQIDNQFVVGNNLVLTEQSIIKNLHEIQKGNELELAELKSKSMEGFGSSAFGSAAFGGSSDPIKLKDGLNFSIEMETGTGKTYVYLRTIHELHKNYGFKKFIIVVPSLAIKEGVIKNLKITKEHFDTLYENPEMDFYVYDPKKRGQLKNFATTNALQILVINIDSFAKFSEGKNGQNIIYQESDWGVPIEYIQGVKPIVIVDEPQNMETDIRKKAIKKLNPLCTLRYSATHKYHYNLVYKLDPVSAYDLGLVKKIEVDSVLTEENHNSAFVELKKIESKGNKVSAKIQIDVADKSGIKKNTITAKVSDDLYDLSKGRELYKNGYIVNEIDAIGQSITFSNDTVLYAGQSQGGLNDEIMKFQIKRTIQNHFEKEKKHEGKGIKVLSLFFIDRVANYREYIDGKPTKGKFATWFEEAFNEIIKNPLYKELIPYSAEEVHNGYFSHDKKGVLKDTKGNTQADDDTYALIMKEKEKLLDVKTPLRFIFSHSALREGWDNPNVFQICTLNETTSEMKKRQEIGRGLRLPVNQEGQRVFDDNINILTVTANESYEDFAKALQTELQEDCGVNFGERVKNKRDRKSIKLKKNYKLDENFKQLWDRIKQKTQYRVEFDTQELIKEAAQAVAELRIEKPRLHSTKTRITINEKEGVKGMLINERLSQYEAKTIHIPDILSYIQSKTKLTKKTIYEIIKQSEKATDIFINPQQFMDLASITINSILKKMMLDGIKYEQIAGEFWQMEQFENEELEAYMNNIYQVQKQDKTLYDHIAYDSEVEHTFAKECESREDIKFYIKLPYWFKIETPIGSYNPDWAVVFEQDKRVYFVAETKGFDQELRESEQQKIACGKKHFEQLPDIVFKGPITRTSELNR